MRQFIRGLFTSSALTVIACSAGCFTDSPESAQSTRGTEKTASAISGVTYDTSGIAEAPATTLPTNPFPASELTLSSLQKSLLHQNDTFSVTETIGQRTVWDGAHWHAEIDPSRGSVLATLGDATGASSPQNEAQLLVDSKTRVASFGIPNEEIAGIVQRRVMKSVDTDPTGTPSVDGYKTFFFRGLHGIPIGEGRAVLTYGSDGSFRRALLHWPVLASEGHAMHTALTTGQILARAQQAVSDEGFTNGNVKLQWRYDPAMVNGALRLTLVVFAILPDSAELGEPRQLKISVDAT